MKVVNKGAGAKYGKKDNEPIRDEQLKWATVLREVI